MSVSINGTNGLTFNDGSSQATSPFTGGLGFRNRIINGDMRIDQRNAGASVTPSAATVTYTLDRWYSYGTQASKFSVQRSTTAPTGFINTALITSLSAYSIVSGDAFGFVQAVEGFNFADLGWGTANAQTVTLSFVVRSSLTGTFGGAIRNGSNNRSYPFTFTINAANTFETKTVTIAGDTTGTWATDNSAAAYITFGLGVGSTYSGTAGAWAGSQLWSATGATSVVGTNGATFYITGVQLEKGSTATSFDYRPYGTELALCQRYYYRRNYDQSTSDAVANMQAYAAGSAWGKIIDLPVEMRATPTASLSSITHFRPTSTAGSALNAFSAGALGQGTNKTQICTGGWSGSASLTAGNITVVIVNTTSAWIDASAEL